MASVVASEAAWSGHQWIEPNPRRVSLASSQTVLQHRCVRCGREFVTVESSGECYAVYASAVSFHRLSDEVTQRWVSEECPGRHIEADDKERAEKIVAHMPVGKAAISNSGFLGVPTPHNREQKAG